MEPENNNLESRLPNSFNEVTPVSKYLAMALFIIMPFLGGWIGYVYTPDKIVVEERVVCKKVDEIEQSNKVQEVEISEQAEVESFEKEEVGKELVFDEQKVEEKSVPAVLPVEDTKAVVSPESKPPYYIESGEVKVDQNNKTFEARVLFGLGDAITIQGVYLSEANLLDEVLQQIVSKSGRNARYVDENRITISYIE